MAYKNGKSHKEKLTIYIDKELVEWLEKKIEQKIFGSKSHGIEACIHVVKEVYDRMEQGIITETSKLINLK